MRRFCFLLLGCFCFLVAEPKGRVYLDNVVRIYFHESVNVEAIDLISNKTGIESIDNLLSRHGGARISQWLPQATDKDRDGDILLSRYYDIKFNDETVDRSAVRSELASEPTIRSAEYVPNYRFRYTPDDPRYNNQWYLRTIQRLRPGIYGIFKGATFQVIQLLL